MKNRVSSRYRSLLARGGAVCAVSILLLCGTGCHDSKDTGKDVIQPTTTTEVSTTCTTTSTTVTTVSNSTTSSTTTGTTTTELMTIAEVPTTTVQVNTVQIESNECEYGDENEYDNTIEEVEPTPIVESYLPITEYERILLCNIVANEAGSDWIGIYDKASVVACVMNRVYSPNFPNSIEGVLTQPYQFSGYYASSYYYSTVTDACIEAVDYYFNNPSEFGSWLYFEGDGTNNYFH